MYTFPSLTRESVVGGGGKLEPLDSLQEGIFSTVNDNTFW